MAIKQGMKKMINRAVRPLVTAKASWPFFLFFIRLSDYFRNERTLHEHTNAMKELKFFFSDLTVRTGFFKGLHYPSFNSFGSSLFPKLLGSYEYELLPFFKAISNVTYSTIIDIGCAEGYYAIGMSMKYPAARVFAYDINETALKLCREMALNNSVSDKIVTGNFCDAEELRKMDLSKRSLIICDCEGYERNLFLKPDKEMYRNCDMVIELHPFNDRTIKEYLSDIFSDTHAITFLVSFNDERKIFDYQDELVGLSKLAKLKAVQEGRPFTMEWMILMANNHLAGNEK